MARKLAKTSGAWGVLGSLVIAGAAYLGWTLYGPQTSPPTAAAPVTAPTPAAAPVVEEVPAPAAPPALAEATIDTFRLGADGEALLAGQSPEATALSVQIDGTLLSKVKVNGNGSFAVMFTLPPADQPRVLTLTSHFADGHDLTSTASLLIAPSLAPVVEPPPAPTEPAPPPDLAEVAEVEMPATPATLLLQQDRIEVLRPAPPSGLALDAIEYGAGGEMRVSGRAKAGQSLRLYVDNTLQAETPVDDSTDWSLPLHTLEPGRYMLRVDQVDATGQVTARAETPFEQADLTQLGQGERTRLITVQPGFTLWGIAQETYGQGYSYVQVFEANRDQIRDPDLIYPGQVFALPQ